MRKTKKRKFGKCWNDIKKRKTKIKTNVSAFNVHLTGNDIDFICNPSTVIFVSHILHFLPLFRDRSRVIVKRLFCNCLINYYTLYCLKFKFYMKRLIVCFAIIGIELCTHENLSVFFSLSIWIKIKYTRCGFVPLIFFCLNFSFHFFFFSSFDVSFVTSWQNRRQNRSCGLQYVILWIWR